LKKSLRKEQEDIRAQEKVLQDERRVNSNVVKQKQSQLELKEQDLEKLGELLRKEKEESQAKDEILKRDQNVHSSVKTDVTLDGEAEGRAERTAS